MSIFKFTLLPHLKSEKRFAVLLAVTAMIYGCSQPNETKNLFLPNSVPDNVVQNLVTSYRQNNLEQYLNCLSENFSFVLTDGNSWGKREEGIIHSKLFSQLQSLQLNLRPSGNGSDIWKAVDTLNVHYLYDLQLRDSGLIVDHARGQLFFHMVKKNNNGWFIEDWHELGFAELKKLTWKKFLGNDYFPLQVGNYWIYEESNFGTAPDLKASILDSITVSDKTYHETEGFLFSTEWGYDKVRKDSISGLLGFNEIDSSDVLIYDFAAAVGDTWSFPIQNQSSTVVSELLLNNQSVETSAGTFDSVLVIDSHLENVGTSFIEYFAPNIGPIATAVESEFWSLKEARIDTLTIPDSLTVGVRDNSWGEIKLHYLTKN